MIYLTGDTHRDFSRIFKFCENHETSKDDLMIILGDAGINYHGGATDQAWKRRLSELPITFMCVRGNHEMRPTWEMGYRNKCINAREYAGNYMVQPEFPSLLFAEDGEYYWLYDWKALVIGGAYSVDKEFRAEWHPSWDVVNGYRPWPAEWDAKGDEWQERHYHLAARGAWWFPDEQLDYCERDSIMEELKRRMSEGDDAHMPDLVLSHTVPYRHVPREKFIPGVDQSKVDNTMEYWLNDIQIEVGESTPWYAGHWHTDKIDGPVRFIYEDIIELPRRSDVNGR